MDRADSLRSSKKSRKEFEEEVEEVEARLSGDRGRVGNRSSTVDEPLEDSTRTTKTVRRDVSSGAALLDEPKISVGGGRTWLDQAIKRRMGVRGILTFPSRNKAGSKFTLEERLCGLKSMDILEGEKGNSYHAQTSIAPESLVVRVEMRRMIHEANLESISGLTRLISPSDAYSPEGLGNEVFEIGRPRRNRGSRHFGGFGGRHNAEAGEHSGVPLLRGGLDQRPEIDPPNIEEGQGNREAENEVGGNDQPEEDDAWRPGDDIIPQTASDYQPIPNFIPRFDPNEATTLDGIRSLENHTLPRLKKKCKSIFSFASLRNNHAVSSRQSKVNNRAHRVRWAKSLRPAMYDTSDIIKRKEGLTGRRLMVGSMEIRILPKIRRKKLLYYLMDVGDGLLITINNLGKWHADVYPEYKDDLLIMHWLIDTRACQNWSFTVDNLCCDECVSSWRIKRESSKIKTSVRRQARCARIICPHPTKIKKFFFALGAKHTSRMRNIKLLVSAENCLNPETISSAVHRLTTTFPDLQKVEVEFQQGVGLLPELMLDRRRRKSIVQSLRHLEKWIAAGERLSVSGLDNHPRLSSAWSEARRGWYWDADRTVRFLWESRRRETKPGLGRRASSL